MLYNLLNRLFQLEAQECSIQQEITAGVTSFFTIAYIVVVNPLILADAGIPLQAGTIATIIASVVGSLLIGLWANAPIVITPGMGINAFFTYTIVQSMGLSWQEALLCVVLSGLFFVLAAVTTLGEKLHRAIPNALKNGITVGIGLFLTFIGLQKGHLVAADSSTMLTLADLREPAALLTLFGLLVTIVLYARNVKGSFLLAIALTTVVGLLSGQTSFSQAPGGGISLQPYMDALGQLTFAFDWLNVRFWTATFSLTMIIIFETMGLLHGMLPDARKFKRAFQASSVSAALSGLFGTSPTVCAAESVSGITAGGRTGLTAVTAALLFGTAVFALPVIAIIPDGAIAPILIVVGGLMMQNVKHIPFHRFTEGFPAFLVIVLIPLTYSIADGIAFGFIAYPLLQIAVGKGKQLSPTLYVVAALFALNFILQALFT